MEYPFIRKQRILSESDLQIPYKALLRWRTQGISLLIPVYTLLNEMSQTADTTLIDDTRLMALNPDADEFEEKTISGRMWGKTDNKTFAVFDYASNWKASFLDSFVDKFIGILVGDGYGGYPGFAEKHGLEGLAGCNDHARRKFAEASLLRDAKANEVLEIFETIYRVERDANNEKVDDDERKRRRNTDARPAFEKLRAMMNEVQNAYSAKSTMSRAITYFLRNYDRLTLYLDNGNVPISTAPLERMIRSVAKVRKDSLFVGSIGIGKLLAINVSLMLSCELAGICYYKYLLDVLPKLSGTDFPAARLDELLPDQWAKLRGIGRYGPKSAAA